MTCPGVLVCVGREAFSPVLVNFIRKSSEEKLPGLGSRSPGNGARSPAAQGARSPPHGAQSRASDNSEGPESRKNGKFVWVNTQNTNFNKKSKVDKGVHLYSLFSLSIQ